MQTIGPIRVDISLATAGMSAEDRTRLGAYVSNRAHTARIAAVDFAPYGQYVDNGVYHALFVFSIHTTTTQWELHVFLEEAIATTIDDFFSSIQIPVIDISFY